jgi:TonB family protein
MKSLHSARILLAVLCLSLVSAAPLFGWGSKGHKMINRLAAESLPADVPAFLKTPEAINEIEYLGPEPDRWRSRAEPELSAEQAPDHFIDIELADLVGPIPRRRYDFIAALYAYAAMRPALADQLRPERVGFQPWITNEVWERLKSAMRDYRTLAAQPGADTKPVEAAILFYAGWLGHYVGDGSQPLHVTVNYNGWVGATNPNGYTTEHTIHAQFETAFVDANVNTSDVQPLMTPVKTIGDEWDDYLAWLRHSNSLVETVYQLDKAHGFDGAGTPDAKQFTSERLAAGASMLRDLIYAAWVKSAEPVPDWHAEGGAAGAGNGPQVAIGQPPSGTHHIGGGVSAPILRYAPNPQFTDAARAARFQGIAIVGLVVDENGSPRDVHIVRSVGMGLDENAIEAVRQYRFTPAMYKGKPVAVEINIEVNFRNN